MPIRVFAVYEEHVPVDVEQEQCQKSSAKEIKRQT